MLQNGKIARALPDRLMVGRHPLEVDILGSSPSPATKYVLPLWEDIFVFCGVGLECHSAARDVLSEAGPE
jgi:hypothetical protein